MSTRNRFEHADFARLEAAVLAYGGLCRFDDHTMYGSIPKQPSLIVDIPRVDPYESVEVDFDAAPSHDLLIRLGFPFTPSTDIGK
jgi:hypothetical protein